MLVGNRPHDTAHGQAVEVVIDENQHTQNDGGQLSSYPTLNVLLRPAAKGGGTAGFVHQAHQSAQNHQGIIACIIFCNQYGQFVSFYRNGLNIFGHLFLVFLHSRFVGKRKPESRGAYQSDFLLCFPHFSSLALLFSHYNCLPFFGKVHTF